MKTKLKRPILYPDTSIDRLREHEFLRCDKNFIMEEGIKAPNEKSPNKTQKLKIMTDAEKENIQTVITTCQIMLDEVPKEVSLAKKVLIVTADFGFNLFLTL